VYYKLNIRIWPSQVYTLSSSTLLLLLVLERDIGEYPGDMTAIVHASYFYEFQNGTAPQMINRTFAHGHVWLDGRPTYTRPLPPTMLICPF
jgi:hypothetical protein